MRDLNDLAHRTLWTFIEAFLGVLIASPLIGADLEIIAGAAIAAVAAAIVPVKEYARTQLQ
jgi:hypothetical protein